MRKRIENAALWTAVVMSGMVVINLQNNSPINRMKNIIIGLIVGVIQFLWASLMELIAKTKSKKKKKK